jgi:hypothetical protein
MSVDFEGVGRLIEPLRAPVRHLARQLGELGKDRVLGLTVFGGAAAGTINLAKHAIHSAVIFDGIDLPLLRQLAIEGQQLG